MILQELEKVWNHELAYLDAEICVLSKKFQQVDVFGFRLTGQLCGPFFLAFILMGEDDARPSAGTGGHIPHELNHVDRIAH